MSVIDAILLALVEGLTEFLPVSSTGHMVVANSLLSVPNAPFAKTYIIAIQLSAISVVPVLYFRRLWQKNLYLHVGMAFVPTAIIGWTLGDWVDRWLETPGLVGLNWLLGGVVFLFLDKIFAKNTQDLSHLSLRKSFFIGAIQGISVVPGVSRAAAAMVGGLVQGLDRKNAAEFSFLLAVPTITAAAAYKLYKSPPVGTEWETLAVGSLVSFGTALITLPALVKLLVRYGFRPFGWYRIVVGIGILLSL
ncbi:MAG: undecaprenyl-diphosphate phosphatase [Bacteroidia bacterium]